MLRPSITLATVAALFGLAACGGEAPDQSTTTAATAPAGEVERYCALTRELDAAGETFFARLGEDATPKEFQAAERRFVQRYAGKLDEVERVAPRAIKADAGKLLAAMRQRAGLEAAIEVDEAQASAAERRIGAYERRHCDA